MIGTQAQTRPMVIATAAVLTLSAFLLERSALLVANKETKMPTLDNEVSSRIAEMNLSSEWDRILRRLKY